MSLLALGGGPWGYNESTGAGQQGITGALGLNNIGLLITTWGKVTEIDTAVPARWLKINDGSCVNVKCAVPADVTIDPNWRYVTVTGISSCEKPDDSLLRLVRVRKLADIVPFQ